MGNSEDKRRRAAQVQSRLLEHLQQARRSARALLAVLPDEGEGGEKFPSREDVQGLAWNLGLFVDLLGAYDVEPSP